MQRCGKWSEREGERDKQTGIQTERERGKEKIYLYSIMAILSIGLFKMKNLNIK